VEAGNGALTGNGHVSVEMLGTRGLPNRYGGSETCIEEVGTRLVRDGHHVRVFCRRRESGDRRATYRGMELVDTPAVSVQALDTLTHSFVSILWLALKRAPRDRTVLHFHGSGNGALLPLARALGFRSVVTVDGADWERAKWGRLEQRLLRFAARMAARMADVLVADSREAFELYSKEWGANPVYIPYGAPEVAGDSAPDESVLDRLGLRDQRFVLFVGRFVPEKGIHLLAEAFAGAELPDTKLVLVGGMPDDSPYAAEVGRAAPPGTVFAGKLYGEELDPVLRAAYAYVQPSSVEGTSPMLLTAMGYGIPIVASGIPENRYTVGEHGIYFESGSSDDLASVLSRLLDDEDDLRTRAAELERRARETYSWEAVAAQYAEAYGHALRS
jgi:glycosyltransferase involved in cell wall biosynthesis